MFILGVIPARGGSKGVKDKNIISINGKPLIGYTIESALSSHTLNHLAVSTDSDKIADTVRSLYSVEIISRPSEFALDDSPIEESLIHAVRHVENNRGVLADIVVWMQPNVPIRKKNIVDTVVEKLVNSDADSCVTCYEVDQMPELMKTIDDNNRLIPYMNDILAIRRQEFPRKYLLDGSIVAIRTKNLLESAGKRKAHIYLGKEIIPVVQDSRKYSIEIDVPEDVDLVRYYMEGACGRS